MCVSVWARYEKWLRDALKIHVSCRFSGKISIWLCLFVIIPQKLFLRFYNGTLFSLLLGSSRIPQSSMCDAMPFNIRVESSRVESKRIEI